MGPTIGRVGMINTFRSVVQFDRITLDPVERRLKAAASVDDYRRIAKRRLPRGVFDYIDGGAEDERTLARNVSAFGGYEFRPRVLRDVSRLDTSTTILGRPAVLQLILAPTGFTRIAHMPDVDAIRRSRLKKKTLFEMDDDEDIVRCRAEYVRLAETLYAGTDPLAPAPMEDRDICELLGFD